MVDLFKLDEGEALLQVEPNNRAERGELGLQVKSGSRNGVEIDDEEGFTRVRRPATSLILPSFNSAIAPCPLDLERSTSSRIHGGAV